MYEFDNLGKQIIRCRVWGNLPIEQMLEINQGFVARITDDAAFILADLSQVQDYPQNFNDFQSASIDLLKTEGLKGAVMLISADIAQAGLALFAGVINVSGVTIRIRVVLSMKEAEDAFREMDPNLTFS